MKDNDKENIFLPPPSPGGAWSFVTSDKTFHNVAPQTLNTGQRGSNRALHHRAAGCDSFMLCVAVNKLCEPTSTSPFWQTPTWNDVDEWPSWTSRRTQEVVKEDEVFRPSWTLGTSKVLSFLLTAFAFVTFTQSCWVTRVTNWSASNAINYWRRNGETDGGSHIGCRQEN